MHHCSRNLRRVAGICCLLLLVLWAPLAHAQFRGAPNDPLYARQWALERIGAQCAWEQTTGATQITVAVIDSGVDLNHPDLVGRLRSDGFDFVDGNAEPFDRNGHGTHVAGIIAAALDNAEGIAGLAPNVQILPIRVMDAEGSGSDRAIAAGITYAVDQGAQVINLSIGSTLLLNASDVSALISRSIRQATDAGVVVVVAAGNDFVPLPNAIVGEVPNVIVVAASDRNDVKATFSNSGPWITVTAPGEQILSTMPTYEVFLTSTALPPDERFRNNYDTMSGTSQATPYVSALVALMLTQEPLLTPAQVIARLQAGAANIYPNHPSYYQRLQLLGAGRIDACATLGGQATAIAGPSLIDQLAPLTIWLVLCGGMLIGVSGLGLTLRFWWRRRPQPSTAPQPQPVPAPPPPLPPVAPLPRGDTLIAGQRHWARVHMLAGPEVPRSFELTTPEVIIGRSAEASLVLSSDATISRLHARISLSGGQVLISDLGSSHGTRVNGTLIRGPTRLRTGDLVQVGQTVMRYEQL
jgi:hypothetical protein